MSTAELKSFIDNCTTQEKGWLISYLITSLHEVPEIRLGSEDLAELQREAADLAAGRNRVTQADAEARWDALDARGT